MTPVTIEQNLDSRQTYLRLKGVGHLLREPKFSIAGDSNEMLGPAGWKNQDIANGARQCLDGDDLLLEMDSRLIAYIEPGRALEVGIPELGFKRRIQPPRLQVFPSSSAPLPPGTKVFDWQFGGDSGRAERKPEEPKPHDDHENIGNRDHESFRSGGDEEPTRDISGRNSGNKFDFQPDIDEADERVDTTDEDGTRRVEPEPGPDESTDGPVEPDGEENDTERPVEPELRRSSRAVVAAALVAGLVVGFFSKYIVDEYGLLPNEVTPGSLSRKLALVQTDAFGPLSEDLKRLPDKSPLGVSPDAVPGITPLTVNPSRSYFNYGAQRAREGNKAEAIYWYKRSVKMIEPEAFTFLGDGYLTGEGAPHDVRTGFQLLRLAAALGSEAARSYLSERLQQGAIPNAPTTMANAYQSR